MPEWEQQEQQAAAREEQALRLRANRRIYGRGLYDGLRMAGITNPESYMNEAKIRRMSEGLTSIAQRVLDAVPIQQAWPKARIVAEVKRSCDNVLDVPTIEHNLRLLTDKGIVREHPAGIFQRLAAKPRIELVASAAPDVESGGTQRIEVLACIPTATVPPAKPQETKPVDKPEEPYNPLEQLSVMADIANDIRKLGKQLIDLAGVLDGSTLIAADSMQRALDAASIDGVKLKQLRELFRSLGGS